MGNSYSSLIMSGEDIVAVTPADADLPGVSIFGRAPKALWIETAGNVNIKTVSGNIRENIPVRAGLFPVQCTQVRLGTTASGVYAIY